MKNYYRNHFRERSIKHSCAISLSICRNFSFFSFFFFSSSQTVCFRSLKQSRNRLFSSFSIAENFHQAQLSNRSFTAYVANIRLFFHIFFFISTKACRSVQYLLRVFSLATGNFSFFLSFLFSFFLFFSCFLID